MSSINEKFDSISIRNVHRQLNEIQIIASTSRCIDWELAAALNNVTRVAGMLCNVIEQHLEGNIETYDPLHYIEEKLAIAHSMARKITNRKEVL